MGFLFFSSMFKPLIGNFELKGLNERKRILKERGHLQRKALTPPIQPFILSFVMMCLIPRMILTKRSLKEELTLFIAKELVPLSFVETPIFRKLFLKQNLHLNFLSRQTLINEISLKMTKKTKEMYKFSALESCNSCTLNFDLWMSKGRMDTFFYIMHFLSEKWEPCYLTIGFF
jgi:hypothetical protein